MINKKEHIEASLLKAFQHQSKLNQEELDYPGFSSPKVRHLLNNIMSGENINYLEIGVFKGSTFISSLYQNNVVSAYALDNWAEFKDYGTPKKDFEDACNKFELKNYQFFEADCYKFDLSNIKNKINVYFFDGEHTFDAHYNALKYYYDILDDEFIFIVDDFDPYDAVWANVEKGTRQSIKDLNFKVIYENHLKSTGRNDVSSWWNGVFLSIMQK
jgi:hypothetical protein